MNWKLKNLHTSLGLHPGGLVPGLAGLGGGAWQAWQLLREEAPVLNVGNLDSARVDSWRGANFLRHLHTLLAGLQLWDEPGDVVTHRPGLHVALLHRSVHHHSLHLLSTDQLALSSTDLNCEGLVFTLQWQTVDFVEKEDSLGKVY